MVDTRSTTALKREVAWLRRLVCEWLPNGKEREGERIVATNEGDAYLECYLMQDEKKDTVYHLCWDMELVKDREERLIRQPQIPGAVRSLTGISGGLAWVVIFCFALTCFAMGLATGTVL